MTDSERLSAATRLYVRLRQTAGRVIDAVWMSQNEDYAREILKLARATGDDELLRLAERFEALLSPHAATAAPARPPPLAPSQTQSFMAAEGAAVAPAEKAVSKYVRSLR